MGKRATLFLLACVSCTNTLSPKVNIQRDLSTSSTVDMASSDLAGQQGQQFDLASSDLAGSSGQLNCIAFADCWFTCLNASSSATGPACITMCKPNEKSTKTSGLFVSALTCGQMFCLGQLNGDGGAGVCGEDSNGNFINHDNTPAFDSNNNPQGDCGECLNDVTQNFFAALATFEGQTATQCVGTRFCNVAQCKGAVNACVNDP
jgi:hypothetical protein